MQTRVYLAAAIGVAREVRATAVRMTGAGHQVVSTWHNDDHDDGDPAEDVPRLIIMATNALQMLRAHILIADTRHGMPCATYSEIGFSLGACVPVIWIQPFTPRADYVRHTNIFDAHPLVAVVHSVDDALELLASIENEDEVQSVKLRGMLVKGGDS